jgi:hypothetical protein
LIVSCTHCKKSFPSRQAFRHHVDHILGVVCCVRCKRAFGSMFHFCVHFYDGTTGASLRSAAPKVSTMSAPSAPGRGDEFEHVLELAKRLQPILKTHGTPHEVLSACIFIAAAQSKAAGRTFEQFMNAMRGWSAVAYDEEEAWRKPTGEPPLRSIEDMSDVAREASRLVFEQILPAIRKSAGGPLIMGLTMALVDVARSQKWPLEDLVALLHDVFTRHAELDHFVQRAGQA